MSGADTTKERERRAKRRYIALKTYLSKNYIAENMNDNLPVFRTTCAGYFDGQAQTMNLHFLDICTNLESDGTISYSDLTELKVIVKELPIESKDMVDAVNAAESDIAYILSGGTAPSPSVPNAPSYQPQTGRAANVKDRGEGFHQKEDHVFSYDEMESIIEMKVKNSVGLITVGRTCGTGFRVGDQYIMTAYHVFHDKFDTMVQLLKAMVEQSTVTNTGTLSELSNIFGIGEVLGDVKTCVERCLAPNNKELLFGKLAKHLGNTKMEKAEHKWRMDTWIAFDSGRENEVTFGLDSDVPFADKDNDILILKLRIDDSNRTGIPSPLHLDEFSVESKMHLIGYLKSSNVTKSLKINANCKVYTDDRQLGEDVTKAKEWWKVNQPDASLDQCRYSSGEGETPNGRTILHASEAFEHRSSGCPAVVIDDYTTKRLVVQLMYLSGYPTRYYETGKAASPPLDVCFESGVSMKNIANILLTAEQEALKNDIFG